MSLRISLSRIFPFSYRRKCVCKPSYILSKFCCFHNHTFALNASLHLTMGDLGRLGECNIFLKPSQRNHFYVNECLLVSQDEPVKNIILGVLYSLHWKKIPSWRIIFMYCMQKLGGSGKVVMCNKSCERPRVIIKTGIKKSVFVNETMHVCYVFNDPFLYFLPREK